MEIIRENGKDLVKFYLRLLRLDFETCSRVVNDLDKNHIIYSCHKRDNIVNILIDVEGIVDTNVLIDYINQINVEYDIYISLRSTYDHGGLDVPDAILAIIRKLKCNLNFSFFSN